VRVRVGYVKKPTGMSGGLTTGGGLNGTPVSTVGLHKCSDKRDRNFHRALRRRGDTCPEGEGSTTERRGLEKSNSGGLFEI